MRAAVCLALALAWACAGGEPVKCVGGGKVVYREAPCPAGYVEAGIGPALSVVDEPPREEPPPPEAGRRGRARYEGVKAVRDRAQVAEFRRLSPCPSTLEETGPCPGWVVDHKKPLACGGADHPANMQWQTVADAKAKDRVELSCR